MGTTTYSYSFSPGNLAPGSSTIQVVSSAGDCNVNLQYQNKNWFLPHGSSLFQRKFSGTDALPGGIQPERCLCTNTVNSMASYCDHPCTVLLSPYRVPVSWTVLLDDFDGLDLDSNVNPADEYYLKYSYSPDFDGIRHFGVADINLQYLCTQEPPITVGSCHQWGGYRLYTSTGGSGFPPECLDTGTASITIIDRISEDCMFSLVASVYGVYVTWRGERQTCAGFLAADYSSEPFILTGATRESLENYLQDIKVMHLESSRTPDSPSSNWSVPESIKVSATA